jgi:hypothetical protein
MVNQKTALYMSTDITSEHLDQHVHKRLRTRVRLYLGISVVIIIAILYRIIVHGGGILYPLAALAVGLVIGIFLSRMFKVSWDKDAEKVVSRIDIYGVVFIVAYIILESFGENLIRQWFTGPEVLTIILSLVGGAVLGRGLGISRKMMQVLRENI